MQMTPSTELTAVQIMKRLPHRYPFLMIDRVLKWSNEEAVAIKCVTMNEWFFPGHFPQDPIMPGVLLGEAMAQTSAFIGDDLGEGMHKAFLVSINLQIKAPVVPGDQLLLKAQCVKRFGSLMKVSAQALVCDEVVATAEITVASKPA